MPVWAAGLAAFAGTVLEIPERSGSVFVMVKRFLVYGDPRARERLGISGMGVWGLIPSSLGLPHTRKA